MDKKTVLAFVLSFLVLFGWSFFFGTKQEQKPQQEKTVVATKTEKAVSPQVTQKNSSAPATESAEEDLEPVNASVPEEEIRVETPLYSAVFSNVGPTIKSFKLKNYRETVEKTSPPVEMVNRMEGMGNFLTFNFSGGKGKKALPLTYESDRKMVQVGSGATPGVLKFRTFTANRLMITQIYRFYPHQYKIDL
ncbi:MAG: membrane protein insertase YidC, partial [Deltaproteobacteria bacterium]